MAGVEVVDVGVEVNLPTASTPATLTKVRGRTSPGPRANAGASPSSNTGA